MDNSQPIITQMVLTKINRSKDKTVGKELVGRREDGRGGREMSGWDVSVVRIHIWNCQKTFTKRQG